MTNQSGPKKTFDRRKMARLKPPFHVTRLNAELIQNINSTEAPITLEIQILVNDITALGMSIFTHQRLIIGEEVEIQLQAATKLAFKAKVCWCQEYNPNTHIISKNHFSYQSGLEFLKISPMTKASLKSLYEEAMKKKSFSI